MAEWMEFIVFLGIGAWLFIAGLFLSWVLFVLGGSKDRKELLFCTCLLLGGSTFLWVAFRDAPFTISLNSAP